MNAFIVFVKFFDWIVAIWVRLVRFIEENGRPTVLEGGSNYKNEIYNSLKKKFDPGGPESPWGSGFVPS